MDNKDKDIENALDDIFGSDFIEIDTNNTPDSINKSKSVLTNETNHNNKQSSINDVLISTNNIIENNGNLFSDDNSSLNYEAALNGLVENDQGNEINNLVVTNDINASKVNIEQSTVIDSLKTNSGQDEIKKQKEKSYLNNKKIILYFIIGFVLGLILIFVLVNYVFGITKVVNCSSSAEDTGYKFTDEYKITYKKNKIIYLENVYTYTALNAEYKEQIKYIKEEKLPVVVNSNGMPGFTYLYETSDEHFKVSGYLDFNLIDFDKVDKINQDLMPISYVKINSKTNYKSIKNDLEKQGYKCIPSK